jgi:phasin
MDTHSKNTASKPAKAYGLKAFRDMAEKGTTQAKDAVDKMSGASTEAADHFKTCYSTAMTGAQDYNNKFIEFTRANTYAAFDFFQKLAGVKSPTEFVELSTEHARNQIETLTEQAKHLSTLAQEVAHATAEPLKTGVAKTFNSVA